MPSSTRRSTPGRMKTFALLSLLSCYVQVASQAQPQTVFKDGLTIEGESKVVAPPPAPPVAASPLPIIKTVSTSEMVLDGHVDDMVWASTADAKESSTMFLLSSMKTLYRSSDGGKTWSDQMTHLKELYKSKFHQQHTMHGAMMTGITHIIKGDHAIIFMGENGMHFITKDGGRSYQCIWHPEHLAEFKLHSQKPNLLLASTLSRRCHVEDADGMCFKTLLMSEDFGETWRVLQDYVVQYDWVKNIKSHAGEYHEDAIFATIYELSHRHGRHQQFGKWDNRVNFAISRDRFLTHDVLVPRGNRFLFTDQYIAVAQVSEKDSHVVLQLSSDGGRKFFGAELEYPMTQHSYTILDTSNSAVFLHVNHNGEQSKWGNVYLSNSLGTNFSLSLPHNRRDDNGKCDFEKLQSMEGVYVANYYENAGAIEDYERSQRLDMGQSIGGKEDENAGNHLTPPAAEVRTVITFDRGSSWEYLTAPRYDALGAPVQCHNALHPQSNNARSHCSLHLHGVTDVFGPFYSSPTAIGLLMATGNIGSELTFREGMVNTYFSRDGGHEWFEIAKGSHIYEFGDHGGIIVMANDEHEVEEVYYSWNEGMSWHVLKFASTPVLVDNIMIEPRGASEKFVLYGTRVSTTPGSEGQRIGVVFSLDFSEMHQRQCEGEDAAGTESSDFERWAPSATAHGDGCLMGRRVEYVRRKRDHACYNPDDIEIKHAIADCECTERDYECDRGYRRMRLDGGACIRDMEVPLEQSMFIPHYCQPGLHYQVSAGYRKVAGDSCVGGVVHEMFDHPCPGSQWHHSVSHGGWSVLVVFIVLTGSLAALTFCQLGAATTGSRAFKAATSGGGKSGPMVLPTWVPAAVATPVGMVGSIAKRVFVNVASGIYHVYVLLADGARRLLKGAASPYGDSKSFFSPQERTAKYGHIGKESTQGALEDDEEGFHEESGESFGRYRQAGDDADFGNPDVADGETGDEPEADLLGISSMAPGPLRGGSAASSAQVPVLRPPRNAGKNA